MRQPGPDVSGTSARSEGVALDRLDLGANAEPIGGILAFAGSFTAYLIRIGILLLLAGLAVALLAYRRRSGDRLDA